MIIKFLEIHILITFNSQPNFEEKHSKKSRFLITAKDQQKFFFFNHRKKQINTILKKILNKIHMKLHTFP